MKTDEVCDRPLDPFAADTPPLDFLAAKGTRTIPLAETLQLIRRYFHVPDPQSAEGIADFA